MPPRHTNSTELVTFHTPEIPAELHQDYLRLYKAELPSIVSNGLDSSHQFVAFRGNDTAAIKQPLSDQTLLERARNTTLPCAVTAHQHGYEFAVWDASLPADNPFRIFTFPGIVGTQVGEFEKKARESNMYVDADWLHEQKTKVARSAIAVSENLVQDAIVGRLFTRVMHMTSPLVNKHACEEFTELLPQYAPQSHLFAVKLAKEVFKASQDSSRARGVTDLQQRRLKTVFDAIAADNPAVGAYKYQIVHDAFRQSTERPPSLRGRLLRSGTGTLSPSAQQQLETRYAGYEKYLPESENGINAGAFLPRPTLGQDAVSAALLEAAAVKERLGEIEPAKVARHAMISASIAGAFGGLVANPATAAPERASTAITLQTSATDKPVIELNAQNVAAFSALPSLVETSTRSGEKCADPFKYTDEMKTAVDKLIARGGKWKNQGIVLDFFLEKCVGLKASAGIVGNTQAESGTNPSRHQVHGSAYGAFQHDSGRRDKLMALPGYSKLSTQLKFAWGEMTRGSMVDNLQRANSPEQGAIIFEELFERAGVPRMGFRKTEARKIYNEFLKELKTVNGHARHGATPPQAAAPVLSDKKEIDLANGASAHAKELKLQPVSFVSLLDAPDSSQQQAASRSSMRARFEALLDPSTSSATPEGATTSVGDQLNAHLARVALSDPSPAQQAEGSAVQSHVSFAESTAADPNAPSTAEPGAGQTTPVHPLDALINTPSTTSDAPQGATNPKEAVAVSPDSTTAASPSMVELLGAAPADQTQAASAIPSLLTTNNTETQPATVSLTEATNAEATTVTEPAQPNALTPEAVTQASTPASSSETSTPTQNPADKPAPIEKKTDTPKPKEVNPAPAKGKETKCAPGSKSLGYFTTSDGKQELCALIRLRSGGEESNQFITRNGHRVKSAYYIKGANGHAIVTANLSDNYVRMIDDARKDGIVFQRALSSFRTIEHQADLYYTTADHSPNAPHRSTTLVASPGNSQHEDGAIDFNVLGADSTKCVYDGAGNCTAPHDEEWNWIAKHADEYDLGVYKAEAWHVDALKKHWATYMGKR
ncbi:MAG: phage tail tip lysozyme [Candidatus Saccharimonadales bacterium]